MEKTHLPHSLLGQLCSQLLRQIKPRRQSRDPTSPDVSTPSSPHITPFHPSISVALQVPSSHPFLAPYCPIFFPRPRSPGAQHHMHNSSCPLLRSLWGSPPKFLNPTFPALFLHLPSASTPPGHAGPWQHSHQVPGAALSCCPKHRGCAAACNPFAFLQSLASAPQGQ